MHFLCFCISPPGGRTENQIGPKFGVSRPQPQRYIYTKFQVHKSSGYEMCRANIRQQRFFKGYGDVALVEIQVINKARQQEEEMAFSTFNYTFVVFIMYRTINCAQNTRDSFSFLKQ